MIERQDMGSGERAELRGMFRLLKRNAWARDIRVRGCFVNGVYIRELLQCLQIADNLTVPVNPRFAVFPELLVPVVVSVILVEGFDLGGGGVKC